MSTRSFSEIRLVNGSVGDPVLYVDWPGRGNALLFDAGDLSALDTARLADLEAVFITHHHVDHFIGLDRIVRANMDQDKVLHVFGPVGTIRKVYDRIKSYEYPFFPFQKIVVRVTDVTADRLTTALLECTKRFPEPVPVAAERTGPAIYENGDLTVESAETDHTVPGLAFALVEKPGYQVDPAKLARGPLKGGAWIDAVLKRLRAGDDLISPVEIHGGSFRLGALVESCFTKSRGSRTAYVTDTLWSDKSKPGLLRLARKAARLYCDSFYSRSHIKQAQTHRHMTATQAGEFAREAEAEELILIHFSQRYAGKYADLLEEARAVFPGAVADLGTK